MAWEDVEHIFRPKNVHMGVMKIDLEACNKCGLCLKNCPFQVFELDEDDFPRQKEEYACFSCYNCMVACSVDAISIAESYHVDDGFYATDPHPLAPRMPLEVRDADGNLDEWNAIERAVFNRRSVRNYKEKPVPEPLIRRVLEAGRYAPSAGNCQPWKFIVVTDKALIDEMDQAIIGGMSGMYGMYKDDEMVKGLVPMYEADPNPGLYDPRLIHGGFGAIANQYGKPFLNAPAVILLAGDERSISGPEINIGICGTNMNLVANSLGIRACWVGFSQLINMIPPLKEKLGLNEPWKICSAMVLGYPKFKQDGVVPREYRPVTWFREGAEGPEIDE
jgi:nitroreductase/NAD-dependent dihydropyrimidine dehydrogenase PreA subunit